MTPWAPRRGFTLIELLVSVVIIAIVASVVVMGLSGLGGNRQLQQSAERLHKHIAYACEQALLNGRSIGLVQTADGYQFVIRRRGQWQPIRDQPALAPHQMPAQVHLVLRRQGRDMQAAQAQSQGSSEDDAQALRPQLACMASGELTPFTAELTAAGADQRYTIVGHLDGETGMRHETLRP